MARLEDQRKPGLPRAPAPPRRGVNPWKLSDSARKPPAPPPEHRPTLLETLVTEAEAGGETGETRRDERTREKPAPALAERRRQRFGLWPLIVLGMAVALVLRGWTTAKDTGNWVKLIAPLLAILFIAHGWWRLRRRRRQPWGPPPKGDEEREPGSR